MSIKKNKHGESSVCHVLPVSTTLHTFILCHDYSWHESSPWHLTWLQRQRRSGVVTYGWLVCLSAAHRVATDVSLFMWQCMCRHKIVGMKWNAFMSVEQNIPESRSRLPDKWLLLDLRAILKLKVKTSRFDGFGPSEESTCPFSGCWSVLLMNLFVIENFKRQIKLFVLEEIFGIIHVLW